MGRDHLSLGKYDTVTTRLMFEVFESVWRELQAANHWETLSEVVAAKERLTRAVLDAVESGERDPVRLKAFVSGSFAGAKPAGSDATCRREPS
jgi:hypothetical protein